jgi:hypothetical protein
MSLDAYYTPEAFAALQAAEDLIAVSFEALTDICYK